MQRTSLTSKMAAQYQLAADGGELPKSTLLSLISHGDAYPNAIPFSLEILNGLGAALSSTWIPRVALSKADVKSQTLQLVQALGALKSKDIMRLQLDKGLALLPRFGANLYDNYEEREFKASLKRYFGNVARWALMLNDPVMFKAALTLEPSLAKENHSDSFLVMVGDKFLAGEEPFIEAWQYAHGSFDLVSPETLLSLEESVILADLGHLIRNPDCRSASEANSCVATTEEVNKSKPQAQTPH